MTLSRSTGAATLAVLLLASASARAEEPPAKPGTHHSHHSHHKDASKSAPAAPDQSSAAPAPATVEKLPPPPISPAPAPAATPAPAPAPAPASDAAAPGRAMSSQAQSDLQKSPSPDRPWVKGVSPSEQRAALELFREGNGLLKESLFVQAAAKYREALVHWDHPGIHYNLALALLNLDQPVEVYTNLQEALKFGAAPLDADKYEHANRYKALIEKQLARIEVTCDQKGAAVTMDGRKLFIAPGRYEALVRVGQHTVVATRTGFVTVQKTPTLPPGEKTTVDLHLFTAEQLTKYKRRWKQPLPWTVLAAGIVIAGVGGIMHWQANEAFKQYDSGVTSCSIGSMTGGCMPNGSLAGKLSTGNGLQASAITAYALGGALIVTGGVLAYFNRARPYHVESEPEAVRVSVVPVVGPGTAGLMATIRY